MTPHRSTRRGAVIAAAAGIGATIGLLVAAEVVLRIGGYVPRYSPLLHAFRQSRLWIPAEADDGTGYWRRNPLYAHAFQPTEFPATKGRALRIFAVGGSVAYGWRLPDPATRSFLAVFARGLSRRRPDTALEAVNAGGLGWGSARVSVVVDEVLRHSPDLVIVLSGHNEFWEWPLRRDLAPGRVSMLKVARLAEHSRLYLALTDIVTAARVRTSSFQATITGRWEEIDDDAYARVRDEYEANVRGIVGRVRAAGSRVVLGTLPANLLAEYESKEDWLADAARHTPGLPAERLEAWNRAREAGRRLAEQGDWAGALREYREAAAVDPGYAHEWREMGRCLMKLGRWTEAREALRRHLDLSRRLVTSDFNEIIRRVGREEGVPVADAAALFERSSPHGIPGYDLFFDSMHPNVKGHELLARAFLDLAGSGRLSPF